MRRAMSSIRLGFPVAAGPVGAVRRASGLPHLARSSRAIGEKERHVSGFGLFVDIANVR